MRQPSRSRAGAGPPRGIARVDFHRTKYGPELLVDAAWVSEMPAFLHPGPHALTFYDILLITRGRGWFWLDGEPHRVRPHRVLFTSPGQVRRWGVAGLEGLCLFFPAAFLDEFFNDTHFLHRLPFFHVSAAAAALDLSPRAAGTLRRLLLGMRAELVPPRADSAHLLRARLYEALVTLARAYAAAKGVAEAQTPNRQALRFRELVEREAGRWHRVAEYGRALAVSPGHLNALAHRFLGRSAKSVIVERLEVEARRRLLYSEESVARIGHALGFRDPSYFTRFFRRAAGRAPSEFRREARVAAGAGAALRPAPWRRSGP